MEMDTVVWISLTLLFWAGKRGKEKAVKYPKGNPTNQVSMDHLAKSSPGHWTTNPTQPEVTTHNILYTTPSLKEGIPGMKKRILETLIFLRDSPRLSEINKF